MASAPAAPAATSEPEPRPNRRRSVLSGVALVLACLAIAVSTVGIWVHQVAFNTDRFTALVTDVVGDPAVIDPLSARISAKVVDAVGVQGRIEARLPDAAKPLAAPLTAAIRDAIDKRLQIALANPKIQTALLTTVSFTHEQVMRLLRGDPENVNVVDGYITIDVFPIIGQALAQLQEMGLIPAGVTLPDLSSRETPGVLAQRLGSVLGVTLPADFGTIQLMPADRILAARAAVQAFDVIVIVLVVLTVALIALSLWLAQRRRRQVVFLAIGTIVALVITRALIRGIEGVVIGGIADQDLAAAVRAIMDTVFDDLRGVTALVLLAAAVVAVVAYVWGRPAWVQSVTSSATGAAGQAGAAVAGQASAGRAGLGDTVRDNRATVEKVGLAVIAFVVVWLVIGLEAAILAAGLVGGFELLLNAMNGSKTDDASAARSNDSPPPGA